MRLYAGTSQQFVADTVHNQIAEKLKYAFFSYYRSNPSPAEINSWRNSLRAVSQVFQYADLMDHGIILEYQLPLTSRRLDCLIVGRDSTDNDNAVIIELKQWEKCDHAEGENEVLTWIGGAQREILHPAAQVGRYKMYLEDGHSAFHEGTSPIRLNACTYLHNYTFFENDPLLSSKFTNMINCYPLFSADDVDPFKTFLVKKLKAGQGTEVLRRIENGKYRPSKKLMEHVGNIIKGNPEYVLLDEQLVVFDKVVTCANKGYHDRRKTVVVIKGGPGTGKSVIAINLMADLLLKGYNAQYATGSRAFTTTLRDIIGTRGAVQFKYFNSYMDAEADVVDVLICDEAHRIRKTSNDRFTQRAKRSDLTQVQEIMKAGKVCVFFIDDNQVVRPDEIGSVRYIKEYSKKNQCNIFEYTLEAQFRCNGSDAFVNWINNTLGISRTANVIWNTNEDFDFQIFDSPEGLERAILEKASQGFSARMTGGFCWQWSKELKPDGSLYEDVVIGNYRRAWNARPEARKLRKDIPKATLWAHDSNGINQIGCVYTAQGFEFDYVGVIFGNDLVYNFDDQKWHGLPSNSKDPAFRRANIKFIEFVKNTYRVLLSRGMKGCYIYFLHKDTERFFKSRMETIPIDLEYGNTQDYQERELISYINALPLLNLRAAADSRFESIDGYFASNTDYELVPINGGPFSKDCFLVRAEGDSMEPKIPDGSLCLFRKDRGGSRNGKIVLCRIEGFAGDAPLALIKLYQSERKFAPDTLGEAKKIVLSSLNPSHPPLEIKKGEEFSILGIFERLIETSQ